MYFQKRGDGYSFIYYDEKRRKNVRLRQSEQPPIRNDAEAKLFCTQWEAKLDALRTRIKRRLEWENKFHNFRNLLTWYEAARKEDAPNSWGSDVYALEYYVFPYFLEVKKANNLNLWPLYFEEFRDHLLTVEPLKKKTSTKTLAYATKNNLIKALNAFIYMLHRRQLIEKREKCRYFSKSKVNRKNEESVLPESAQQQIFENLKSNYSEAAIFFWISLHTGMRLNELLGLSLADFFAGSFKNKPLEETLKPYGMVVFGYIALDSQPKNHLRIRDPITCKVERKPLKGKRAISHSNGRIIPIFERTAFNYLVGLWNQQQFFFHEKRCGQNPSDYLLFPKLNKNTYSSALRKTQVDLAYTKLFTPHDTRHTYSTWLAEVTGGNYTVCKMILGHQSIDITQRYVHLSAQIHKSLRLFDQIRSGPMKIFYEST